MSAIADLSAWVKDSLSKPKCPLYTIYVDFTKAFDSIDRSRLFAKLNHYRTIGRCSGPAHYDVSIRQAARAAFVTSSFKIFLTQTFLRCGATCYILPSRAMSQLFNGVNIVYRSVEVYLTFCSYLRVLVRIQCFYNGGRY